jgi:hypothetical protein
LTKPAPKNLPASVRQKLGNLARERNVDFGLILVKYGLERILFRLSRSPYRDVFILKGALLFELWTEQRYRPTRDADFLARGHNAPERFATIFRELCVLKVDEDGLRFDADTVGAERISEDADYEGVRVTFVAFLERAKIPIQIDIGFGDIITPAPSKDRLPRAPRLPWPAIDGLSEGNGRCRKTRSARETRYCQYLLASSRSRAKPSRRRFKTPFRNAGPNSR